MSTRAGEPAATVGVEDFWLAVAVDRLPHRFLAEIGGQGVGQPPRQHTAARPVYCGKQIDETALHRDVGDARSTDVVGTGDCQVAQQVNPDILCVLCGLN